MTKCLFCICLLQLGYLLKSMYISLLLIISVSVTLDTGYQSDFVQLWVFFLIKKYSECSKNLNTFLFLRNACNGSCSPRKDVVKVVPEVLYITMIDSLRQQFCPRMRQAGRDRKSQTAIERGYFCPMYEKDTYNNEQDLDPNYSIIKQFLCINILSMMFSKQSQNYSELVLYNWWKQRWPIIFSEHAIVQGVTVQHCLHNLYHRWNIPRGTFEFSFFLLCQESMVEWSDILPKQFLET